MKKTNLHLIPIGLFLLSGFLFGCAAPRLLCMGTGTYAGFTSLYSLAAYERSDPSFRVLFPYLVSVRLPAVLFLWMSGFTTAGLLFHLLCGWWLLASAAMLLSLFLLRDGAQGIALFLCCIFPQWLLYFACLKKEIAAWADRGRRMEAGSDAVRRLRGDLAGLAQICLLCLAGCACEAFLGAWTLKIYLRKFSFY